ncbi:MAG TPA: O-antigen ligase family protein [Tepidisphaeraceae bacterium]|nr:O-antigen ligase family protein [Tepidisphaeraceae bacterium]
MPRTATKSARKSASTLAPAEGPWHRLTQLAFLIAIVLVIVRATMSEAVRDELLPVPGTTAAPATPGAASGLFLDLLFCLPAMLVLVRRLVDGGYSLRFAWSHVAMLLLGAWTLLSASWASDKFIAIVNAAHWTTALVLLWAASQVVDSWLRLRLLGGVGFALLLVLLAQGYYYRLVDLPDLQREWKEHQADMLHQHGADANSTEAIQIGKNIESGDVVGFSVSRNTYAALLVFLGMVSLGIALQRLADRDHPGWVVPIAIVLVLSLLMLYRYVQSKTAYATPLLGAALIAVLWRRRDWISARSRRLYWITIVAFVIGIVAVMGHGLKHGSLFQLSLTYRWQYWVGAARLLVHHPWLGVGWGNFGQSYLGFRLPQAVEEIKDPHNFLIRALVELGIPGGLLMLVWMLRLWWELTQLPDCAAASDSARAPDAVHRGAILFLLLVPTIAVALNAVIAIDWQQKGPWIILELFKRAIFLLLLVAGLGIASLRSMQRQELDDRPAPWLLASILVAGGLFLLHNLIDFSLFEPGPMFVFALLCGGALGLRLKENPRRPFGTALTIGATVLGGVVWLVAAGGGAWNVALAESMAHDADEMVRAGQGGAAVPRLLDASRLVSINPDYAYRAALLAHDNPLMAREMLAAAITADPMSVRYHRAMAELDANQHEWTNSLAEYRKAVELDPNNIELRIEFAELLRRRGEVAEARRQYQRALELNDALPPQEIRRLPVPRADEIRAILRTRPES